MPTSTQRFRLVGEDDASKAFLEVAAASRLLKSSMDDVSSSALGLGKLVGGTGLIPIFAGAAAATLELTTALGAASGALGVFGLSAGGLIVDMVKQQKAIGVTEASLSKLTKGTAEYAAKAKELHDQQAAFNKTFGPAAKGFDDMKSAFSKFKLATSGDTTKVLGQGFELIASVLPKLVPVSNAAAGAIGGLIDDLQNWTEGPSFAHLLHFLETSGPKDITAFGHILGNTLQGLGGFLGNFVGPGDHAAKTLEHLTERFDAWGHSKGVSHGVNTFLHYVHDNGPQINSVFSSLAEATPKIATALGQLGAANLTLTGKFLTLIAGLPQKQFNLIADGLFAMAAGSKALTLVTGLGAVGKGLAGILTGGSPLGKGALGKGGGLLGGVGVQKVFVVNPGFGKPGPGIPGGGGGPTGGPTGGGGVTAVGALAGLAGVGAGEGAISFLSNKIYGSIVGNVVSLIGRNIVTPGAPDPQNLKDQLHLWKNIASTVAGIRIHIHAPGGLGDLFSLPSDAPKVLKSTTTEADALQQRLSKASQGFDTIGHSAAANSASASASLRDVKGALDSIPANKTLVIDAVTGQATLQLKSVQALIAGIQRVVNVHVNVTRSTNALLAETSGNGNPPPHRPGKPSNPDKAPTGPSKSGATHVTNNYVTIAAPVAEDPYTTGERVAAVLNEYYAVAPA